MNYAERPHILVIDDDERIRTLIVKYLWKNDFVALQAGSAEEAYEILKNFDVDLIVADVMMPGDSGFEFTKTLRADSSMLPVILLTALGEVENRIEGLQTGADDYLPKPFDPKELVLRIQALLRRVPKKNVNTKVQIGSYWFIPEDNILEGEKNIKLTELETKLLKSLLKYPNEPVSREKLAELCDMSGTERAIDVQVTRLRKKLEEDPANPKYLRTLRGKGYMLRV